MIGDKIGYALNSVGFGDTTWYVTDEEIAVSLLEWSLRDASKLGGGIDTFYFVQALNQPSIIEKCIILVKLALGEKIVESSIIICTKGNLVIDPAEFDEKFDKLVELAKRHNIKGGVFDFRGHYFQYTKHGMKAKIACDNDIGVTQNM